MNSKGFTILELAVVLAIVAVLAIIAIPMFIDTLETARTGSVKFDLAQSFRVAQMCYDDGEPATWENLEEHGMVPSKRVMLLVEDPNKETFMMSGWHLDNPDVRFQVNHEGDITRRVP